MHTDWFVTPLQVGDLWLEIKAAATRGRACMVLVPRNLFGLWECCECECDSIKIQAVGGGFFFFFPSFAPLCHKWRLENRHELSGDRYHQSVVESLNKNHDECVACYPPGGNGRKSHICIYKLPFRNKLPHVSCIYIY